MARQPNIPAPTKTSVTIVNATLKLRPSTMTRRVMPTATVTSHATTARRHDSGARYSPVTT